MARPSGFLETGAEELAEMREAFAVEIPAAIRRINAIELLGRARHAGLID